MKGDYTLYKTRSYMNAWETLKDKYPELSKKLGYWNFRKFLSDMSDTIIENVFDDPDGFELPKRLGTLRMIGVTVDHKPMSLKYGKVSLVRTDNIVYSLRWIRNQKHSNIANIYYFNFKTSILVRKEITKRIKEDKFMNWLVLNSFSQIKHLRKTGEIEDTYNKARQKYNKV